MKAGRIHWPSILQFGLSALGVFALWSGALLFITIGISGYITGGAEDFVLNDPLQLFMLAVGYAAIGILALPSAYYALWHVLDLRAIDFRPALAKLEPALWIVAFPLVLLVGYWVSSISMVAWLVLPFMHLLAVGLPLAWILYLSIRSLPFGSPQRMWGVITSGLLLAPTMALFLEGLVGVVFVLFGVLYISRSPDLVDQISRFTEWMNLANPSPELLFDKIGPMMVHPVVILLVIFYGAVAVPLIEEALKPIGVWLLVGKKLSPAAGFVAGAMSGAAYALCESLVLTSDGQQWVSMMVARIGTAIIHIFTSGLVGWALVQARYKRTYVLLGVSYLVAVLIHGLWNALTLFSTFSVLAILHGLQPPFAFISYMGWIAPFGLVFLTIATFITLLVTNRLLGHSRIKAKGSGLLVNGTESLDIGESVL